MFKVPFNILNRKTDTQKNNRKTEDCEIIQPKRFVDDVGKCFRKKNMFFSVIELKVACCIKNMP